MKHFAFLTYGGIRLERRSLCLSGQRFATRISRYGICFSEMKHLFLVRKPAEPPLNSVPPATERIIRQCNPVSLSRITGLVRARWSDKFTSLTDRFSKHLWSFQVFSCKIKCGNILKRSSLGGFCCCWFGFGFGFAGFYLSTSAQEAWVE